MLGLGVDAGVPFNALHPLAPPRVLLYQTGQVPVPASEFNWGMPRARDAAVCGVLHARDQGPRQPTR